MIIIGLLIILFISYYFFQPSTFYLDTLLSFSKSKNSLNDLQHKITELYRQYSDNKIDEILKKYKENEIIYKQNYDSLLFNYNELKNKAFKITEYTEFLPEKISIAIIILSMLIFVSWYLIYIFKEKLKNTWFGKLLFGNITLPNNNLKLIEDINKITQTIKKSKWKELTLPPKKLKSSLNLSLPTIILDDKTHIQDFLNKIQANILLNIALNDINSKIVCLGLQIDAVFGKKIELIKLATAFLQANHRDLYFHEIIKQKEKNLAKHMDVVHKLRLDFFRLERISSSLWPSYKKKLNQDIQFIEKKINISLKTDKQLKLNKEEEMMMDEPIMISDSTIFDINKSVYFEN